MRGSCVLSLAAIIVVLVILLFAVMTYRADQEKKYEHCLELLEVADPCVNLGELAQCSAPRPRSHLQVARCLVSSFDVKGAEGVLQALVKDGFAEANAPLASLLEGRDFKCDMVESAIGRVPFNAFGPNLCDLRAILDEASSTSSLSEEEKRAHNRLRFRELVETGHGYGFGDWKHDLTVKEIILLIRVGQIGSNVFSSNGWEIRKRGEQANVRESCGVVLYQDAKPYFYDLYHALENAKSFIYIIGWDFNPNLRLLRAVNEEESIGNLLRKKAEQGLDVKIVLWGDAHMMEWPWFVPKVLHPFFEYFFLYFQDVPIVANMMSLLKISLAQTLTVDQVRPFFANSKVKFELQSAPLSTSHHQKSVVCDSPVDGINAFVGGIDLADGRYDTESHPIFPCNDSQWANDWYSPDHSQDRVTCCKHPRIGWHDIHAKFTGEIAVDVLANVESRSCSPSNATSLPTLSYARNWKAQLFRSMPSPFEDSIQFAYINAISQASKMVYIENQFFISSGHLWLEQQKSIANLVAEALLLKILSKIEAKEEFFAMIVLPLYPVGNWNLSFPSIIMNYQFQTLEMLHHRIGLALLKFLPSHRVSDYLGVFCLGKVEQNARSMIYVHSKFMIVDDSYMLLGSANINDRSLSGKVDTEIAVGAWECPPLSNNCSGELHAFRFNLWKEHMGSSFAMDLISCPLLEQARKIAILAEANWDAFRVGLSSTSHLLRYPAYFDHFRHRFVPELIPKPGKQLLANGFTGVKAMTWTEQIAEDIVKFCQ